MPCAAIYRTNQRSNPWKKVFKKNENWRSWKCQFFWLESKAEQFSNFFFFFASSPWKSVNIYRLARMGRNFDDYPGFQPKTTFMYYFAHDCTYIRGFTKFGIKVLWRLQFFEYLRTLRLKFQKAWTKIEVVLSLPSWLSQRNLDSQQGRLRTTSVLVRAFWNFKLKVLEYSRICSLLNTLIPWSLKNAWITYYTC